MAHNLARWTARIGLGEQIVTTKTLRRRVFALAGRLTRSARRLTLHLPQRWPWEDPVQSRPGPAASHSTPSLTAPSATDPTSPPTRTNQLRGSSLLPILLPSRASHRPLGACAVTEDPPPTSHLPQSSPGHLPCSSLIPLLRSSRRPSVSFGGFGLSRHPITCHLSISRLM